MTPTTQLGDRILCERIFRCYVYVSNLNILAPVAVYAFERLTGRLRIEDEPTGMGHGPWYNDGNWQIYLVNYSLLMFLGLTFMGLLIAFVLHVGFPEAKPGFLFRWLWLSICQIIAVVLMLFLVAWAVD